MSELTQELSALAGQWIVAEARVVCQTFPTPTQLCVASPLRWALIIGADEQQSALFGIGLAADPSTVGAMFMGQESDPIWLSYRQFGGLVQQAWYGYTAMAGTPLHVIELLLQQ